MNYINVHKLCPIKIFSLNHFHFNKFYTNLQTFFKAKNITTDMRYSRELQLFYFFSEFVSRLKKFKCQNIQTQLFLHVSI